MSTTSKARGLQTSTRLHIAAITIELKRPSKYPTYAGIFIDGNRVHKLPPIAGDLPLRWSVDLPIDVGPHSQVTLQIKEAHLVRVWQSDLGSYPMSDHPDWLGYDSTGVPKEIVEQLENFTISVKFSPPLGIGDTQLLTKRAIKITGEGRGSVLGKLGDARAAIETIVAILEHVEDVHPIAKAALGSLTQVYKHLEEEEKYDESLRDLAQSMADMLSFAETVNQHAKIVQLKETITQMMHMVEDASRFILKYQSSSVLGRSALSLVSSKRRRKIDEFIQQFDSLRKSFDRGVTVQVYQAVVSSEERSLIDRILLAHSAGYDPNRSCMEGTRTQILQDIIDWAKNPGVKTRFLWIHGTAGAGKSSIASSTARELEKTNQLGTTFFCSRDKPDLRNPAFVLPTIAARLAITFPAFGKAVADQLRQDPHIGESAMQFQYEGLFALPFKKIGASDVANRVTPLVIVVDALDECGSPDIRATLLKYLLEISRLATWLKIVATSRPEPDITRILGSSSSCTSFPLPFNDTATYNDILFFTQTRMAEITESNNLQPSDWPGELRTKRLAELAGGLFIWAETAYKFIASGYVPEDRLEQLLSKASTPGIHSKLDALYATTIAGAFQESDSDNLEIFRLVVGTIVTVVTPLPIQGLAALLRGRISETGIRRVVNSFRSVLYEDEQNDFAIRVCHLSFLDFITDHSRCPQFFVDLCQHHTSLATVSLQTMQDLLSFNICNLESSDIFNDQIPDLGQRVKSAIPIPLKYSCVYWMSHLRNSSNDLPLLAALERFLAQQTVLFWVEALSLLGEIPAAIHGLPLVVGWFQDLENANSLFLADIYRFILAFKEPITRSTPHLYISSLPFAPTQSLISQRFLPSFPNTISLDDRNPSWSPCLQTLEGHSDVVLGVSWSPDGKLLASGSFDHSICVWDSTTGALMQRLRGHSDTVYSVSFSPNSRLIASGSWDQTIQLWDVETGEPILPPFLGHSDAIFCVIFSPDGKHLASCSRDVTIRIWDTTTGELALDPFQGHSDLIQTLAYSPDGTRIVSCSHDNSLRVWDVKTGRTVLGPLRAHTYHVYTVDFSPDGRRILSGSSDCTLIVCDAINGDILLGPLPSGDTVSSAKFSQDGRRFLTISFDSKIRIWDGESGIELAIQDCSGSISSACFSPDGQYFVTGSSDRTVRIWEFNSLPPSTSSITDPQHMHTDIIFSVAISPDGKYIASGSKDKTIRVWHADTGTSTRAPLQGHTEGVSTVAFSPDGRHILSASGDLTLRLWTVSTWECITWECTLQPALRHIGFMMCATFSPSGHFIMSGSCDDTIRLQNPVTGEEICEPLPVYPGPILPLDISSDGRLIGSGSRRETVQIWDAVSRQNLFDLSPPDRSGNVWSLSFSPDGRYIASYSDNGHIRLWDIQRQVVLWKSPLSTANGSGCCIFSQNGQHIFCSSLSLIFILDAKTGSVIHAPFKGHGTYIPSLAISPNGKHLISGSNDQTIRVWDIEFEEAENHEELLPDAQNLSGPVGDDGWVRLQTGDPLLWIPTEYRDGLSKRAVFSIPPTAQNHPRILDCSRFRHGNAWTEVRGI